MLTWKNLLQSELKNIKMLDVSLSTLSNTVNLETTHFFKIFRRLFTLPTVNIDSVRKLLPLIKIETVSSDCTSIILEKVTLIYFKMVWNGNNPTRNIIQKV